MVVVSIIAVKRSKESAALKAGIGEEQSNFTEFHLRQGRAGGDREGGQSGRFFFVEGSV